MDELFAGRLRDRRSFVEISWPMLTTFPGRPRIQGHDASFDSRVAQCTRFWLRRSVPAVLQVHGPMSKVQCPCLARPCCEDLVLFSAIYVRLFSATFCYSASHVTGCRVAALEPTPHDCLCFSTSLPGAKVGSPACIPRFAHVFRGRGDKQQNTNQHVFSVCVCLYVCVCVRVCVCVIVGFSSCMTRCCMFCFLPGT